MTTSDADKVRGVLGNYGIFTDNKNSKDLSGNYLANDLVALIKEAKDAGHGRGYEEALSVHEVGRVEKKFCPECGKAEEKK